VRRASAASPEARRARPRPRGAPGIARRTRPRPRPALAKPPRTCRRPPRGPAKARRTRPRPRRGPSEPGRTRPRPSRAWAEAPRIRLRPPRTLGEARHTPRQSPLGSAGAALTRPRPRRASAKAARGHRRASPTPADATLIPARATLIRARPSLTRPGGRHTRPRRFVGPSDGPRSRRPPLLLSADPGLRPARTSRTPGNHTQFLRGQHAILRRRRELVGTVARLRADRRALRHVQPSLGAVCSSLLNEERSRLEEVPCSAIRVERTLSEDEEEEPKGEKERAVPIIPQLQDVLREAIEGKPATARVVVTRNGTTPRRQHVLSKVVALQRSLGMERTWSVHALRHAFCSHLVRVGVGVEAVRALAGHSSIRVTNRYVHATGADLQGAMERGFAAVVTTR